MLVAEIPIGVVLYSSRICIGNEPYARAQTGGLDVLSQPSRTVRKSLLVPVLHPIVLTFRFAVVPVVKLVNAKAITLEGFRQAIGVAEHGSPSHSAVQDS